MKKIIIGLLIIVLGLGVFFALGLTVFNNDAYVLENANYNEAKKEIERGWIPIDIPKTAVNINEIHILDSNKGNGYFDLLDSKEINEIKSSLNPLEKKTLLDKKSVLANWWNDDNIKENIKNGNYTIGKKGDFYYAITNSNRVYFWIAK